MTRRLVIHAGAYKTATSTIQSFFALHRREMSRRFNVLYPRAGKRVNVGVVIDGHPDVDSYGHHVLGHLARRLSAGGDAGARLQATVTAMADELTAAPAATLFLSTELLSFCPLREKRALIAAFAGFDIEIVYAVRHPVDFIESMNNQTTKNGKDLWRMDRPLRFLQQIEEWGELVETSKVHVLVFHPAHFDSFIGRFMAIVGGQPLVARAGDGLPKTNASVSHKGARLRTLLDETIPMAPSLKPRQRHTIACLLHELDRQLRTREPLVTLDAADRARITELNAGEIGAIGARYLPPGEDELLRAPQRDWDALKKNVHVPAMFDEDELRRVFAVIAQIRQLVTGSTPAKTAAQRAKASSRRKKRRRTAGAA